MKLATRLAFFAAGFAVSCWAPLIPLAKARIGADDAALGLMLLCVGIGSVFSMPFTGWLCTRVGSKPVVITGGLGIGAILPFLAWSPNGFALSAALLAFGASLGALDVAMNIHAVEVEKREGKPLMSGFHGLFSLGGIAGAAAMTLLLSFGLSPLAGSLLCSALTIISILAAWPRLISAIGEPSKYALPKGIVLLLAGLCAVTFLVEGAILDWGALLSIERRLTGVEQSGLGYILFSIAMTLGRLSGDRIIAKVGDRTMLAGGGIVAALGLALALMAPWPPAALTGFCLIGLGASTLVPILFSLAGRQKLMPVGLAIAAVTTTGYAGILVGPAAIGFVSKQVGLQSAFWMLVGLVCLVPLTARWAAPAASKGDA